MDDMKHNLDNTAAGTSPDPGAAVTVADSDLTAGLPADSVQTSADPSPASSVPDPDDTLVPPPLNLPYGNGSTAGTGNAMSGNGSDAGTGNPMPGNGSDAGTGNAVPGNGNTTGTGNATPGNGNTTGTGNSMPGNGSMPRSDGQGSNPYNGFNNSGNNNSGRFSNNYNYGGPTGGGYGYRNLGTNTNGSRNNNNNNNNRKKGGKGKFAIVALVGVLCGMLVAAGYYSANSMSGGGLTPDALKEIGDLRNGRIERQVQEEAAGDTAVPNPGNAISEGTTSIRKPDTEYTTAIVTDVSDVVERAMPAMVSITNNFTSTSRFFGQTFESKESSGGSGIIVGQNENELLIVTNQHVIDGSDELLVKFIDGEEAQADVKGYDAAQDIAVLSVPLDDIDRSTKDRITTATLGDSESLKLGEPTIAIGNALGYGQSVTTGVVSALDRTIGEDRNGENFIQTDAAINPGNSGGALLNIRGEVIGINSNKLGGSIIEGMGYAIPISRVQPLIEDFMNRTPRTRSARGEESYLGISGVDVTGDVAAMYGMPIGVYVGQVHPGTAAEEGGLETGDVITAFDGSTVRSMEELQSVMTYYAAGTEVEITYQRGAKDGFVERKTTVILGNKKDMEQ